MTSKENEEHPTKTMKARHLPHSSEERTQRGRVLRARQVNVATGTVQMQRSATCKRIYITPNTYNSHPVICNHIVGCVFTTPVVWLNIPEGVMFTDHVKRIKNDRCFHEEEYISR